jgi:hypothetical protein
MAHMNSSKGSVRSQASIGAFSSVGIAAVLVAISGLGPSGTEAAESFSGELVAGDKDVWPIEVVYSSSEGPESDVGGNARFRGTYWDDFEWEILTGEFAGECFVVRDGRELEGYQGCNGPLQDLGPTEPGVILGPSAYLWPGADMHYRDLDTTPSQRTAEDRPASNRSRSSHVRGQGYLVECGHTDVRKCREEASPREASGTSTRVIVDERTGLPLLVQAVEGAEILEDMVVESMSSG